MKKITIKLTMLMTVFTISLALLCGCYEEPIPTNTTIICKTANSANISTGILTDAINDSLITAGNLSIIIPDGEPWSFASATIPAIYEYSGSKQESKIAEYNSQIQTLMSQAIPVNEEADILGAITLATRNLNSQSGEKKIVIFHNGLSTTGILNFTENDFLHQEDVLEIINWLRENLEIPDMTDISVQWYGLGDVISPQSKLSGAETATLESIWQGIFDAAGATVEFKTDLLTYETSDNLPNVSIVEVYTPELDIITLDESKVQFQDNTAELITSESQVLAELSQLTSYMMANPDEQLLLAGTTAKYGIQTDCEKLSLARANVIKNILISAGISEDRLHTVGLGYENDFYVNDLDANGNQIEEIAKTNRSTIIMSYNSDTAQALLNI